MPTPPPLRLESIRICGYRAFPHPIEIPLKGKSLVLYGENGSGKSSLGKAVRDFLDYRAAAVSFDTYQYRHPDGSPEEHRCVTLSFTDGAKPPLSWTHEKRDGAHTEFRDMARSRGWIDYRVVWRASEVQYGDSVEIFRPLVEEILPGCQRGASNETFGQAWEKIVEMAAKKPMRPPSAWRIAVERQRMLVLSAFNAPRPTAELASQRNLLAAALANDVWFAHVRPGGLTETLSRRIGSWGVPVHSASGQD